MKLYAQTVNNLVNLIGGVDVGLPLPAEYLANNPHVQCIEIENADEVKDYYENGVWYTSEEWYELHPPDKTSLDNSGTLESRISEIEKTVGAMLGGD